MPVYALVSVMTSRKADRLTMYSDTLLMKTSRPVSYTHLKKAKSIVTLSSPTCRNLLYAMLYFICPKTASGSIHRLPLCLIPSSESNLSRACRLYWFNRWLTSIIRFPCALKQLPRKGQPSHLCALYRALSVMYPLAVLSRLVPMRFMCCPIGQT